MADRSNSLPPANELSLKVREWLSKEGYPLEFQATNILRSNGFYVRQGLYVRDHRNNNIREIDVAAFMNAHVNDHLFRLYHVLECKYSRDKPWVVFTSPYSSMAKSACAAQSIGSEYGKTIMWIIAGDAIIKKIELFNSPDKPGFNGREAFSKGSDRFYSSMQSVTDCSRLLAEGYDLQQRIKGRPPTSCVVVFPVILLDGYLFEAYFSEEDHETQVRMVQHVRCHWRGSTAWRFHATIDIVTLDFFDEFCKCRAESTKGLIRHIARTHQKVDACFKSHSLDALAIRKAGRGIVGVPPLLREALQHG